MDLNFWNFFCNTTSNVLKFQWFSHFLIPGTYTQSVRRTPNHTDRYVTFSRSCDQGKITKKEFNGIIDVQLIFWVKFQNCPISTCLIYLTFWCNTSFPFSFLGANTAVHLCLQYMHHFELRHYLEIQAYWSQPLTQARICFVPKLVYL